MHHLKVIKKLLQCNVIYLSRVEISGGALTINIMIMVKHVYLILQKPQKGNY